MEHLSLFSDVLTIDRTKDYYRILYDVKGRFALHRIRPEEATVSLAFSVFMYVNSVPISHNFIFTFHSISCVVLSEFKLDQKECPSSLLMMAEQLDTLILWLSLTTRFVLT